MTQRGQGEDRSEPSEKDRVCRLFCWCFLSVVCRASFRNFVGGGGGVASSQAPAQLPIACSTVKQERAWYISSP